MLRPGKRFYRHPSLIATTIVLTLALMAVPTTWALTDRPPDINAKIAQLKIGVSTIQDVVRLLGKPTRYGWEQQTFTEENLPAVYVATVAQGPQFLVHNDLVGEIWFEGEDLGYVFRDKIRIGSSLDDVLAVLGQPNETVVGEEILGKNRVLYKDPDGRKGYSYFLSARDGVRMFFLDSKVIALYQTEKESDEDMPRRHQVRKTLAAFDDCRWADLSKFDLSDKKDILTTLWLDEKTKWPTRDKMPAGFSPSELLKSAMNPGLGVRKLHARGITGKGVSVGIIDQPLYRDHPEFAGKIAAYRDVDCELKSSMHGPAVASLLVGKQCGTAPDARLYFVATPLIPDAAYQARALDWLVEQNKALSADQKIRVISISGAPSGPGSPFKKNNEMWDEACQRAEAAGALVLDCTNHHGFIDGCRLDADDPEDVAKCTPGFQFIGKSVERGVPNRILAPVAPRTFAEEYEKGQFAYQYAGKGGLSWAIPYTAGVLAMGWQVRPDLSQEQMKKLLFASARELESGHRIIDPENFIRQVQAAK
ncbi:MAG: hypothetical protein A2Y76_09410 [Planctomycetes bacterium RBG_13_60_9]|nr:MAG: hypothetical protein A2Y76_09410 [Planctomycetes bacterium RBG_13_60_9]